MNYELDSKMYNGKRIQPQVEWENNNPREFINTNNYYTSLCYHFLSFFLIFKTYK